MSAHKCGQTWERSGSGRNAHLRLLCPRGLVTGCAPVQVVPQGVFELSRGCLKAQGSCSPVWCATTLDLQIQLLLSHLGSGSARGWCAQSCLNWKKHQTTLNRLFHDALQTPTCSTKLCTPASGVKQTPQPILPFSGAKISGFERLNAPGCSADLSCKIWGRMRRNWPSCPAPGHPASSAPVHLLPLEW